MPNVITTATPQAIETNPMKAALMAIAAGCSQDQDTAWWSPANCPFEEVVGLVRKHVTDAEDEAAQASGPEAVAAMLRGVCAKLH